MQTKLNQFRASQYKHCKEHIKIKIENLKKAASYKPKNSDSSCKWEDATEAEKKYKPWNDPLEIPHLVEKAKEKDETKKVKRRNEHGVPRSLMPDGTVCTVNYDDLADLKIKDRHMKNYTRTRLSVEKVFGTWWKEQEKQLLRLCLIDDNDCGRRCNVGNGECKEG